jgi:hypothetical protein
MTLRFYQQERKAFEIKVVGSASIGDVSALVSKHPKASVWRRFGITVKRCDGKGVWVENGSKYQFEQNYDADSDPRLNLRIRYDAPDRTYIVEQVKFDPVGGNLGGLFDDLKRELGFELPRPTQCSFTPGPWADNQEVIIATQLTRDYSAAKKQALKRRSFTIELEE